MQKLRAWWKSSSTNSLQYAAPKPFVIVCALLVWYFFPLFIGKSIGIGDNFSLMVPGKVFTAQWLVQGIVPVWNPYILGGISWIGDINQSVLYPSSFLFVILNGGAALNTTVITHLLLSAGGMIVLLRYYKYAAWQQTLSTLLWLFSPQMIVTLNNLSTLQSLAWMPWVVWAGIQVGERRFAPLLFILFIFLQLWGGYPQYVLYTIALSVLLHASQSRQRYQSSLVPGRTTLQELQKWLSLWIGIGLATIAVTAILWVPFLSTLQNSTRAQQTAEQAATGSLTTTALHRFIQPYLFDQHLAGIAWGPAWNAELAVTPFLGVFGLIVLVVWARTRHKTIRDITYAAVLIASVLFAFGEQLPGFIQLQQQLPILSASRGSSTVFILMSFVWAVWLPRLLEQQKLKHKFSLPFTLASLTGALVLLILFALSLTAFTQIWQFADAVVGERLSQSAFHTLERDQLIVQSFAWFTAILLCCTAAALTFWQRRWYWLVTIVVVFEAMTFSRMYFFFVPAQIYDTPVKSETAAVLLPPTEQYRVLFRNYNVPYTDVAAYREALIKRAPFTDSYVDATELHTFTRAKELQAAVTPDWNQVVGVPSITGYTTLVPQDMSTVFMAKMPNTSPGINRIAEISPDDPALQRWAVRYYLVDTWYPLYGEVPPATLLAQTDHWQLYELPAALPRFRFADGSPAELVDYSETPNKQTFVLTTESDQVLIIADRWDQHWKAEVNGERLPITNYDGLRSIFLTQGTHQVTFWYDVWSFFSIKY